MNNSSDLSWSQPEHQFEPIGPNGEEEFANLLDLDLDINFPTFDSNGDDAQNHGQPSQAAHLTHIPQQNLQPNRAAAENAYQQQQMSQFQQGQYRLSNDVRQQQHIQHLNEISQTSNSFSSTNIHPPYAHHQQPQPQQFHNVHGRPFPPQQQPLPYRHTVPPTPNSMEMHGDAEKYLACLDPQTRATLEQRYQLRNDDPVNILTLSYQQQLTKSAKMSFTPLVSPAVTPHETQFQMPPEFTIPGAYFSPLTSPMLGAQRNSQKAVTSNPRNTVSPAATSPVDPDVDMLDGSTEEPAKKLRKKISNSGPRAVANATRMRQSPLSKAQRKRGAIPGVVTAKEVSEMFSDSQRANARSSRPASSAGLNPGHTRDSSEAESISPEPLSESVMRPPPKPSSKTQSPAILPQNQSGPPTLQSNYLGSPATPASLMRIQQQQAQEEQQQQIRDQSGVLVTSASTSDAVGIAQQGQQPPSPLGEFALPEAAGNTRPQLQNIDTSATPADDQATPRVFAREAGTPGSAAGITPGAISATVSAKPSPRSSAIRSPSGPPGSSGSGGKIDSKGGRNNKKRNSTSSALVSPALRPKISPSIKPLLPEGGKCSSHCFILVPNSNKRVQST